MKRTGFKMSIEKNMNVHGIRNYVGNMNDNLIVADKIFGHINNYKRSRTLMNQSDNERDKMFHELTMYREFDNIELAMRKLKNNIKYNTTDSE